MTQLFEVVRGRLHKGFFLTNVLLEPLVLIGMLRGSRQLIKGSDKLLASVFAEELIQMILVDQEVLLLGHVVELSQKLLVFFVPKRPVPVVVQYVLVVHRV